MPERATVMNRSEKSAEVVVAGGMACHRPEPKGEGPKDWKDRPVGDREGMTQMFTKVKLAKMLARVKPRLVLAVSNRPRRASIKPSQESCEAIRTTTSTFPTARCGPACRVVREGSGQR